MGGELSGTERKLHNGEPHKLCSSPNSIIGVIKSSTVRWMEHVARMWEVKNTYLVHIGSRDEMKF